MNSLLPIKQVLVMRHDLKMREASKSFAEVCYRVNREDELMDIHNQGLSAGVGGHLITDRGRTEFHGQPTPTCLALGPDIAEKVDLLTEPLELL